MPTQSVTEVLKEATKDLLTEDTLKQIETIFNESVDKKTTDQLTLQLETALVNQDEAHTKQLKVLLEKIDNDHSAKLEKVVQAITESHTHKLKRVISKYQSALNNEAKTFKEALNSNISQYLDLYLEKVIPQKMINEAVSNNKAKNLINKLRNTLGVDFAFSKTVIKEGVLDGKQKLVAAQKDKGTLIKENAELKARATKAESTLLLEKMTSNLPKEKKDYLTKILSDKAPEFIKENFNYTVELFDNNQEEALQTLKESAAPITRKIDRPTNKELITEKVGENEDPQMASYLSELGK